MKLSKSQMDALDYAMRLSKKDLVWAEDFVHLATVASTLRTLRLGHLFPTLYQLPETYQEMFVRVSEVIDSMPGVSKPGDESGDFLRRYART
jgi:hypothetical protein